MHRSSSSGSSGRLAHAPHVSLALGCCPRLRARLFACSPHSHACSPRFFVALFLPQLPGVATQPTSPEEHAQNFGIVIEALGELEDGPALETSGLDATALAEGNLQALNDLALDPALAPFPCQALW